MKIKPDQYVVVITDPSGKKKLLLADITRKEADGFAVGMNATSLLTGQRAQVAGFYRVKPMEVPAN